ncbi:hypothetical protein OAT67_02290 [Bacteriovoracaceae bacterium]|nr:hypothetical protein [Bacteriovoracaceae bacterium]
MLTPTTDRETYTKNHCWQYEIRKQNLASDLNESKLTYEKASSLKISDFSFSYVPKVDKETCQKIKEFITKHEWLGTMPHRPTHRFIATYKDELAGVVVMSTPNAFSLLLGKENRDKEKLISRGACISWSPKNLASALIMYSIRWMVANTEFRYFTAYSDTEAKELGTIYQACNFTYLGKNSGARAKYFDPKEPDKGWFTDRVFRHIRYYKRYANELSISWQNDWNTRHSMLWKNVPPLIEVELKRMARVHQSRCYKKKISRKHKYVYVLGRDKRETKKLRSLLFSLNPKLLNLTYPKQRGT